MKPTEEMIRSYIAESILSEIGSSFRGRLPDQNPIPGSGPGLGEGKEGTAVDDPSGLRRTQPLHKQAP